MSGDRPLKKDYGLPVGVGITSSESKFNLVKISGKTRHYTSRNYMKVESLVSTEAVNLFIYLIFFFFKEKHVTCCSTAGVLNVTVINSDGRKMVFQ